MKKEERRSEQLSLCQCALDSASCDPMQTIYIDDPAWQTTFPRPVAPQHDEWFPGLLLRCDEVNQWGSRTTLAYLLHPGPEKYHRCWRTETPNLTVIQPNSLNLDFVAQLLALPTSTLLATTYHAELTHLYGQTKPRPHLLSPSFTFHLCPQCISEARMLRRTLALPHITICPSHHIALVERCPCGAPLHLFHQQAPPFTCHICGRDWAELPQLQTDPASHPKEQQFQRWYELFFSTRAPPLTRDVLQFLTGSILKRSLGSLIALLVERKRSPQELLNWIEQQSRSK